jgi:phenylacetate-coenzyme A ligase PaaK-like adenylate-forming protein
VIFEPELETLGREQLRALQTERLQRLVRRVKERVPLYRGPLADVEPDDLRSPVERKLTLIEDLRPDVIACTPSYALTLVQAFAERGVEPARDEPALRRPWRGALDGAHAEGDRRRPRRPGDEPVRSLSEVIGPGVSCECVEARDGLHVNEDHFLPEVVDPGSGRPLPEGELGVLVFTTLTKEALPLVRYWTGDLTTLTTAPCACGRTSVRMGPIVGRTDDMLIVRGVNVYPSQVGAVLGRVPRFSPHFGLEVHGHGALDEIQVIAVVAEGVSVDDDVLRRRVEHLLRDTIGCSMSVRLVAPGAAPRSGAASCSGSPICACERPRTGLGGDDPVRERGELFRTVRGDEEVVLDAQAAALRPVDPRLDRQHHALADLAAGGLVRVGRLVRAGADAVADRVRRLAGVAGGG